MLYKAFGNQSCAFSYRMLKTFSGRAERGCTFSANHKKKISESKKAWYAVNPGANAGVNNPRFGKMLSEDVRSAISAANNGKKMSEDFRLHRSSMMKESNPASRKIDVNGIEYPNIASACEKYGCSREAMANYADNMHKPRTRKNALKKGIQSVHFVNTEAS